MAHPGVDSFGALHRAAVLLVVDNFSRRVTNSWGNAAIGGPYALYASNRQATAFAVNGYAGTMMLSANGANRAAYLPDISARDVDETVRVSFDKPATGSGEYAYLLGRHLNDESEYRGKLHIYPSGRVTVQATRVKAGVEDNVGSAVTVPGLTYRVGQWVRLRLRVIGGTLAMLQLTAWADNQAQPIGWLYRLEIREPRLQGAGSVGLRAYLAGGATNAPTTASFDDLRVDDARPQRMYNSTRRPAGAR